MQRPKPKARCGVHVAVLQLHMKPFVKLHAVLLRLYILMKLVVSIAPAAQGCVGTQMVLIDGDHLSDFDLESGIQNGCAER